jgi:site-specific recombinase XerD
MTAKEKLVRRENYLQTESYLDYLQVKKRRNEKTITRYRAWFKHPLVWAMDIPFEAAHTIHMSFNGYVESLGLAQESQKKVIETTRAFFTWVKMRYAQQYLELPDYWIEDLIPPPSSIANIADYVKLEDVLKIINLKIDNANIALKRDQAMSCMLFGSAARADAAVSIPIKAVHLNAEHPYIEQYPSLGVRTKNGKSARTYLHKIPELLAAMREWDEFVRANYPEESPWYVPIHQEWGEQSTKVLIPGINRSHAVRKRLRILHGLANIPYKSPHKYRHGYAVYGLERCKTMLQYHNLSRNMMHDSIAITDKIYVFFEENERGRILSEIYTNPVGQPDRELEAMINSLGRHELQQNIILSSQRLAYL